MYVVNLSQQPRLYGVALAAVVVSFIAAIYYNVLIAWAFIYLIRSFESPLPWSEEAMGPSATEENCTYQADYEDIESANLTLIFNNTETLGMLLLEILVFSYYSFHVHSDRGNNFQEYWVCV